MVAPLTAATDVEYDDAVPAYHYDDKPYQSKYTVALMNLKKMRNLFTVHPLNLGLY